MTIFSLMGLLNGMCQIVKTLKSIFYSPIVYEGIEADNEIS